MKAVAIIILWLAGVFQHPQGHDLQLNRALDPQCFERS